MAKKTFFCERDVTDMHAAGVTEIEVDDDVVLTDLAREKAIALGLQLKPVEGRAAAPAAAPVSTITTPPGLSNAELIAKVKARVMARLGTTEYNAVLDQVIPQVIAQLSHNFSQANPSSSPAANSKDEAY